MTAIHRIQYVEMMSKTSLQEALQPIVRIITELGGYFTFMDEYGQRFIIGSADELKPRAKAADEKQLPLPTKPSAGAVLERINREIALYQITQQDEAVDDLAVDEKPTLPPPSLREPLRVRFEPLRGDLPPELQE